MSTSSLPLDERGLGALERELAAIQSDMVAAERGLQRRWRGVPDARRDSARNLLHYLAMRRRDLRALQGELGARGLSSLGRAESEAMASVTAVLAIVRSLRGGPITADERRVIATSRRGAALLKANTRTLLGPPPAGRDIRIMITMPSEAADDGAFIRDLLESGMDCMRINTAHDDVDAWDRMLHHLEGARAATGRPCRTVVDLAGPKLRTGPIQSASPVIRWRPSRDRYGRVVLPARIWLTGRSQPPPAPASAVLPVSGAWLASRSIGDVVKLFDARGSMRSLTIVARGEGGIWAESQQTAYIVPGTTLHVTRGSAAGATEIGDMPPVAQTIRLATGETLVLTRTLEPGSSAVRDKHGDVIEPAFVGVTLPDIFADVQAGQSIWIDDGSIGGVIRAVTHERIDVAITRTRPGGARLGADKGINLPDSTLRLPALTPKDREDLRFIGGRADLVGYSFVRTEADVRELQSHLATIGAGGLGIVLKIETRQAFEELPALLLAAMSSPAAGVMIARGDLAIECGFERLAEVQEEILWMAEASHTPVIWATQVLENLAKTGIPSRAEITDAAMAERAECVMLNKGPYVLDAVRVLHDILTRMQGHQRKKSSMLRDLHVAERFLAA